MPGPVMGGLSAGIQEEVSHWQWAVREDFGGKGGLCLQEDMETASQ